MNKVYDRERVDTVNFNLVPRSFPLYIGRRKGKVLGTRFCFFHVFCNVNAALRLERSLDFHFSAFLLISQTNKCEVQRENFSLFLL